MRRVTLSLIILLCSFSSSLCLAASPIQIENAKARATFALAKTGAVYLTIVNQSNEPDTLLSVSVADTVASEGQIHNTLMVEEIMQMREMEAGIPLLPDQAVKLTPGGMHIMLMGLESPLKAGENFTLTLHFANSKPVDIVVPIVDFSR